MVRIFVWVFYHGSEPVDENGKPRGDTDRKYVDYGETKIAEFTEQRLCNLGMIIRKNVWLSKFETLGGTEDAIEEESINRVNGHDQDKEIELGDESKGILELI